MKKVIKKGAKKTPVNKKNNSKKKVKPKSVKAPSKKISKKKKTMKKKSVKKVVKKKTIPNKKIVKKPVKKAISKKVRPTPRIRDIEPITGKNKKINQKNTIRLAVESKENTKKAKSEIKTNTKLKQVEKKLRQEIHGKENIKLGKKIQEDSSKIPRKKREYVNTGVPGFDQLFEKNMGIPEGAAILVEGGPGSGKTIFCLTTMHNRCKEGKKCLYMSFEESENDLLDHMEAFGWPAREYVKKGLLRVKRFDAIDVSRSIEALLSAAKKELLIEVNPVFFPQDFDPDFVAIDSLTSIASAFSGQESRFRVYMAQLFRYLEAKGITNFLVREVSSPSHIGTTFKEQGEAVSFLSDGIIVLYNVIYDSGERETALEILKMRGCSFKKRIVHAKINSKGGLEVFPNKILSKNKKNNFNLT